MGNFMRLPHATSAEGLDFAIVGIPFDTAASFRAGARFGPNGVRNISAMIKPNNVAMGVNIMDSLKGADLGDVPVIPDYIHETYAAIEQTLDGVLECGAVPISIGGDHAITLGELRAIAKKHGKVSLVHFDSHLDLEKIFRRICVELVPWDNREAKVCGDLEIVRIVKRTSHADLN